MVRRRAIIPCEYCDKRFTTKSLYKVHQKKVHGVKKWQCEFCGRRFAERGTLTNHRRTHTKEQPFSCETCGRKFSHRATLLNHKKTHNNDKEFGCDYCGKRFHRKSNMSRHIQVVHLAKGKKCRRRRFGHHHRLSPPMPPMLHSDSSSDGSPLQVPPTMPPPPPPLDIVMRQMGFPNGSKALSNLPSLPDKVTFSVTYQQHQKAAQSWQRHQKMLALGKKHAEQHQDFQLPPALRFKADQMATNIQTMEFLKPLSPSKITMPPFLPPAAQQETMVKEEPLDERVRARLESALFRNKPPSLSHSRSTSPIITGNDDLMMKAEETPSPSPASIQGCMFKFPKRQSTPISRNMIFNFTNKRDSVPDRIKRDSAFARLSVSDIAPDYVPSAMSMTMCVPSPIQKGIFTYGQTQEA